MVADCYSGPMTRLDVRQDVMKATGWVLFGLFTLFVLYECFAMWRAYQRTPDAVAIARQGELKASDLSADRRAILLAVEDPSFDTNSGVDWSSPGQGATTIGQALVKRLYFDDFKPGFDKIEQTLIARFMLQQALTKDEQLTAFLNHAYFGTVKGRPVTGFTDAARTYYDRSFFALTQRQYVALVGMLMAPRDYDPKRQPRASAERVERIERLVHGECRPSGVGDVTYEACQKTAPPV